MGFKVLPGIVLAVLLGSSAVSGGSLKDIEHVVIFMQENRSWDSVSISLYYCLLRLC
jgi:phospholipase C